jgi:excisionase family DNA binding protein
MVENEAENYGVQNGRIALSVAEVAKALGIGRSLAWKMVNNGVIPSFRVGRRVLVLRTDVEAWALQQAREAAASRAKGDTSVRNNS